MRPGEALTTSREIKGNPVQRCKERKKAHEQKLQTMRNLNSSVIGSRNSDTFPSKVNVKYQAAIYPSEGQCSRQESNAEGMELGPPFLPGGDVNWQNHSAKLSGGILVNVGMWPITCESVSLCTPWESSHRFIKG